MSEREAELAAEEFRAANDLGTAPVLDLVALIEQAARVDVAVLPVESEDEHGLTMVDPERGATVVAVATSDKPMRWRSNLAHELGHLEFEDHRSGEPVSLAAQTPAEARARAFARHLLLPEPAVAHFLARSGPLTLAALSDLVQLFQVSPAIAAVQLHRGGHIDDERRRKWSEVATPHLAARFGWADHYSALQALSAQRRAPQRLLARAVSGYLDGVVRVETLAGVRGVSVQEMADELVAAGLVAGSTNSSRPATDNDDDPGAFLDLSWLDEE